MRTLTFLALFLTLSSCMRKQLVSASLNTESSLLVTRLRPDSALQRQLLSCADNAFIKALFPKIRLVTFPEANTLADAVITTARNRRIRFIVLVGRGTADTAKVERGYKTTVTCNVRCWLKIYDLAAKSTIINREFRGKGTITYGNPPMRELSVAPNPGDPAGLAIGEAFRSVANDMRLTLKRLLNARPKNYRF